MHLIEEHGFVGNVWVRQNYLSRKGDVAGGHVHYHDHVSLLVRGSVEVAVDENEPKVFNAPTFIVIKKERKHRFVALEDHTVFYCVFAMRDIYGNVIDIADETNTPNYGANEAPEYTWAAPDDYWGTSL